MDWNKEIRIPRPSLSWLRRGPSLRMPSLPSLRRDSMMSNPLKRSSVKRPSLGRPSIKGPSLSRPKALRKSPSIKVPRVASDLYADLRDRHLLPLVVMLIAAMIAAPILLGNTSDKKTPDVAVAGSGTEGGGESSFTVVPAARDLRSPAKRLAHRQALDPFRVDAKAGEGESSETTGASEAGGTGVAETSAGGNNEIAITGASTSGASTAAESSPSTGAESSTSTTTENVIVQNEVVAYTVDMKAGVLPGELKEQTEVEAMTKLPNPKNPVVLFVGLSQDNDRALFLMTSKVTGYYGAVHCTVDKQACQMVELKPGHSASFSYLDGGKESRYKVVLKSIEPVVQTRKNAAQETVKKTGREHPAPRGSSK